MTLIEALKAKGWTQRELARQAGLSEQEVSRYAKGEWPDLAEADAIAKTLENVEVHELVAPWTRDVMESWRKRMARNKKEGGK